MPPTHSLLSPEAQLLILTAGGPANDALLRRLLGRELDWSKVGWLAQQERATSILWQSLQSIGTGRLPPAVGARWRRLAMVSEFQLRRLEGLLHEAVQALATRGIDVMLLKGSALAYTAYASFAERPMGDLDLLVRPERAHEAWLHLLNRGWTWPSAQWPARLYTAHHHLPPLVHADAEGFRLELHTDLFPDGHPFHLSAEALWPEAQQVCLDQQTALVPDPLRQLVYLCIHFAWSHQMQWGSWRTFRDVEALTRHGAIAWPHFVDWARQSRAATCCFWTLRLARNLAGVPIPDDVLHALHPPRPEFLLKRLECHYVLQLFPTDSRCPSMRVDNALWELGMAPAWSRHGSVRPWQVEPWADAAPHPRPLGTWSRRLLSRARHVGVSMGYLRRITAAARHAPVR